MHFKTIIFTAGIALGIVVGFNSPIASEIGITAMLLAIMQGALLLVERKKVKVESGKRDTEGVALSLFTFLFSLAVFIGVIRVQLVEEKIPYVCMASCTFEAKIISSPEKKDTYQSFVVRPIETEEHMYDIQIRAPLYPEYAIGERVELSGKVIVPEFIFPHTNDKSPVRSSGGFDYVSYLHTRNVGSEMMFPKINVIDSEAHTVTDYLGRWKEDMIGRMELYVAQPASSLSSGMLFGNSSMSKDVTEMFRTAGLSHIIVLSGFNIAIVITFVLFVFAIVPLVLRIILATFFVVMFVLMVGGEVSILRATLMAFIGLLATLVGRHYVARQALLLSLLVIIMYEPYALIKDVSLHLSFLATAGIVYVSEPIKSIVNRYVTRRTVVELITTTIAAYVATLPYVMYTFGTVSVYALLANIVALPLVPFAMLLSFLTIVTSYASGSLALVVGYATTMLTNCIIFIAETVERLPFARFSLPVTFFTMCILYVVLAFVAFYLMRRTNSTSPEGFAGRGNETAHISEQGFLTDVIKY